MSDSTPTSAVPMDTSPLDFSDDSTGMIASCSILAGLATIAVALRYYARHLSGAKWQLDDWLIVLALVLHHGLLGASIVTMIDGGLGRDIRLVVTENPTATIPLFKTLLASEVLYGFSSSTVKLSVLALYWRIFPTNTVRYSCYILGSICIMWTVAIEVTNFLQCRPLEAFWHIEMQMLPTTKCLDTMLFFLGNSIANCIIDLATILLPIGPVMKLQMNRSKKFAITAIFFLGALAFVASLVRTIMVGKMWKDGNINFTKQFVVPGVTTVIEIYVAIVGACLPVMTPLYRKIRYGDALQNSKNSSGSSKTYYHSGKQSSWKQTPKGAVDSGYGGSHGSFSRLYDNENQSQAVSDSSAVAHDIPLDKILVKSDMTLTRTTA
uniref:Rhodopsin domain-containing protein n=1 Tax=Bionectria ochroleuca TaxID=29856 RepID=A0A8H7K6A6_BIOOC